MRKGITFLAQRNSSETIISRRRAPEHNRNDESSGARYEE
jgi:hypothetical protein